MKTGNDPATDEGGSRSVDGRAWDCPECGVIASVRADVCEVCFAELDEFRLDRFDDPPPPRSPFRRL
jgi:hypothetical protein